MYLSFLVILFAIVIGFCLKTHMVYDITGDDVPKLGDLTYIPTEIHSPIASGFLLKFLSWILSQSPLSSTLLRNLLTKNGFWKLRSLGAQLGNLPPLHFPMMRLSKEEYALRNDDSYDTNSELGFLESFINDLMNNNNKDKDDNFQQRFPRRTIRSYHAQYMQGVKPSLIMTNTMKKIEEWEQVHNLKIFTEIIPESVMDQALASDERYRLGKPLSVMDGVPVGVKDNLGIKDHTMYNGGSPLIEHRKYWVHPTEDDIMIKRLRDAGAIILGHTVMIEGGVTPLGWSSHWQGPLNVYNIDRYPGGSSSGSAVAVASGLMPATIGGDGGGSIRIPASMMGVHGLATTNGRIPASYGLSSTLLKFGPLASTAEDAAIVYALTSPNVKGHFFQELYDGDIKGLPSPSLRGYSDTNDLSDVRIGIWKEWFNDSDGVVKTACEDALNLLKKRGATLVDIALPNIDLHSIAHSSKIATEFAAKYDKQMHDMPESMEANTKVTIAIGKSLTGMELLGAERFRRYLFNYVENLFIEKNLTVITTPTIPNLSPVLSEAAKEVGENNNPLVVKTMKYQVLGNFIGIPGYSVPVGYGFPSSEEKGSKDPVPIGLHFYSQHWKEHHLFRLAHMLEHQLEKNYMPPPIFYDPFENLN
jgi:Asp-tRNA(Asn)/Glu-tRNA(Gln) amidotransferase A subunit family amidase